MKIAVWSEKGGVGKTTTVVTLARLWREYSPLVIDADGQGATQLFLRSLQGQDGQGARIQLIHGSRVGEAMKETRATRVLVDCPPDAEIADMIMPHVDAVIVPCVCEPLPARAAIKSLRALQSQHPNLRARVLLTLFSQVPMARKVRDSVRDEYGERVFATVLARSRAVPESSGGGKTVFDMEAETTIARQYRALGREIETWPEMN